VVHEVYRVRARQARTEQAHITNAIDGGVLTHARDSRKMRLAVMYFAQAPVDELGALESPVDEPGDFDRAYDGV
jgi:hypothetical protein